MNTPLYENEVMKRKFFSYLRGAEGCSEKTIIIVENSILLWQDFTREGNFGNFGKAKAINFVDWLKNKKKARGDDTISLRYCYGILEKLRRFFEWLSQQPGYKSKITATDVKFLRLTKSENMMAIAKKSRPVPSLEEVKKAIEHIEIKNEIDRRDKALLSLALLTGARISALISLPLKSFDKNNLVVYQDPYDTKTKFSKPITTALFPLTYKESVMYFLEWYDYLYDKKNFKLTDPLFPSAKIEQGEQNLNFRSSGKVEAVFWKSSGSARKIFEKRFGDAGIAYYHPHSFRHLLVREIMKIPLTEEQKKAASQNFGHAETKTTFGSYGYGQIADDRQIELVRNMKFDKQTTGRNFTDEDLEKLAELVEKQRSKNKSSLILGTFTPNKTPILP